MVKLCCHKWILIPLIVLSVLTIVESKRRRRRAFNLSHRYQQHLITNENRNDSTSDSIFYGKKLSSNVNATEGTMATSTTSFFDVKLSVKEKTLLDLEKPTLFDDTEGHSDLEESSNDTHVRVKRTDFKFVNKPDERRSLISLKSNYFKDLTDSFPRKSSNAEYRSLRKRHVKSSNDHYNTSNYRNASSNGNGTFFNSQVTETNRYLDGYIITDSKPSKIRCNDVDEKVGTIFNLEANTSQTYKPDDSMSKNVGVYKKRSKKKSKSNKGARRRVLHGKKRKLGKHVNGIDKRKGISSKAIGKRVSNSLKTTSNSNGKQQKIHTIRNNLPKIVDDDQIESNIKKRDSIDVGSEIDKARTGEIFDYKRSYRKDENEQIEEGTLIDEEKDLSSVNDNVRDKRSLNKRKGIVFEERDISSRARSKRNENNSLTTPKYPNVLESTPSSLSMLSETNQSLFDKSRGDRAVKSIEEIKELAEKLVTKVNELQSYLSNDNERKYRGEKFVRNKKLESRDIEIPHDNATIEEEVVLETPKLVDECVRIGDLSSALKTLDDRNASFDKFTRKDESGTERINLLNDDRTGSLTKRMIRKSRIKRKSRRKWGRWTGWSSCSVSCGKGRQIRWRHCLRDCSTVETEMEEKACQMPACPPGKFLGIF